MRDPTIETVTLTEGEIIGAELGNGLAKLHAAGILRAVRLGGMCLRSPATAGRWVRIDRTRDEPIDPRTEFDLNDPATIGCLFALFMESESPGGSFLLGRRGDDPRPPCLYAFRREIEDWWSPPRRYEGGTMGEAVARALLERAAALTEATP